MVEGSVKTCDFFQVDLSDGEDEKEDAMGRKGEEARRKVTKKLVS